MFPSSILRTSRTTYRGARGSGPGSSSKTAARSSPASRNTLLSTVLAGRAFKRSQTGLYDNVTIQSGNTIPKSRQKTARVWQPNVQRKRLRSEILDNIVRVRLTTRAQRTIKKYGGLDAYVANRDSKILGAFGRQLRSRMAAEVVAQDKAAQKQVPANIIVSAAPTAKR